MKHPAKNHAVESLRRHCRSRAKMARGRIPSLTKRGQPAHFDRGYFLGLAHAYEMVLKHIQHNFSSPT